MLTRFAFNGLAAPLLLLIAIVSGGPEAVAEFDATGADMSLIAPAQEGTAFDAPFRTNPDRGKEIRTEATGEQEGESGEEEPSTAYLSAIDSFLNGYSPI